MRSTVVGLIAAAVLCACGNKGRGGLLLVAHPAPGAKLSCVWVQAKDGAKLLGETRVALLNDDAQIGIGSAGWPADITLVVTPLVGPNGCEGTPKQNGLALERAVSFPQKGVETVVFELGLPDATLDADRDGYASAASLGPDCDDANPLAFPGANEDCSSLDDLDCKGQGGCADARCTTVSGCAQPATKLVFTSASVTVDVATCSPALEVESRSMTDAAAKLPSGTVLSLAGPASLTFYSDAACATAVTQLTSTQPQSRFTFFFKASSPGTPELAVTSTGLTPASQLETVRPPPAAALEFATAARSVTAGGCEGPFEVEARDGTGTPRPVANATPVNLTVAPLGAVTFFSDAACATAATSVSIAAAAARTSFWVKPLLAGAPVLTGTAAGLTPATQVLTIAPGVASTLAFVTAAQGLPVGTCSNAVQVRAEDANGNAAALPVATLVDLTTVSGLASVTFHSDSACNAAAITQVTLGTAAGSVGTFYFKGSQVSSGAIRAATTASLSAAQQTATVGAGPPNRIAFLAPARTVVAGVCSQPVTVEVRDSNGNPTNPPAPISITLAGVPAAGFQVFTDPSCAVDLTGPLVVMGTPSATFRFKATATAFVDITASATGLMSDTQRETVDAAAAKTLSITTAARTVTAGQCSTLDTRLAVLDLYGNAAAVTNLPLTFAATLGGFTFHAANGCSSAVPATMTGSTFDFRFRGTTAGFADVTVSSGALTPATQREEVVAGPASVLTINSVARSQTAGACSTPLLTVQTQDDQGNVAAVTNGLTVSLGGGDGGVKFFPQAGCVQGNEVTTLTVPAMASTAGFAFSAPRAGTLKLLASASGFMQGSQDQTILPGTASALAFTSPPVSTPANVCSMSTVMVSTVDAFGNAAVLGSATTVSIDAGTSGVQVFAGPACATPLPTVPIGATASSTTFHVKGGTEGTFALTAQATGLGSAVQNVTIAPGVSQLVFTSAAQTKYAGQCSDPVRFETRNAGGGGMNPATDLTVALTARTGATYFSDAACTMAITSVTVPTTQNFGTYHFRAITAGTSTLAITAGALSASQAVTIHPAVRTGTCTITNNNANATCAIGAPALFERDRSLLLFQVAPPANDQNSGNVLVRCHLADTANIFCARGASPNNSLTVYWQTLTLPTGMTVQHLENQGCTNNATNLTIADVGTGANTFLLASSSMNTAAVDDDEANTVILSSGTQVIFEHANNGCASTPRYNLQVVRVTGAEVSRGNGLSMLAAGSVTTATSSSLAAVVSNHTMLLYTLRAGSTGNDPCERQLRGYMPDNTHVEFHRANGNPAATCTDDAVEDIAWQRVQWPGATRVQPLTVNLPDGTLTTTVAVPAAVDSSRTLVLSGNQSFNGTSMGETTLDNSQDVSPLTARFSLNAAGDMLTVTRVTSQDALRVTVYVVEVDPF